MDVELIIILVLRFKQDNIDLQKLLLGLIMIPQLIFGVLHVLFLKCLLEISYLNLEMDLSFLKMMIT